MYIDGNGNLQTYHVNSNLYKEYLKKKAILIVYLKNSIRTKNVDLVNHMYTANVIIPDIHKKTTIKIAEMYINKR